MKNFKQYKEKYKDDRFYREIFIDRVYEPVYHKKKDIVIDVGALGGEFSFWIEAGMVWAIEPENEHYKELEDNIREFGVTNVKPFKIALAGENGVRNLQIGDRGGAMLKGEGGQQIIAKTLATFMQENNISYVDVLKIDVEGAEYEIFNAPDFKEVAGSIACIIGEHLETVGELLCEYGFKPTVGSGNNIIFEI